MEGNYYGYSKAISTTRDELTKLGVEWTTDADLAFCFCAPHIFKPTPGKRSVLYTMFESPDLSRDAINAVQAADCIITPSEFCRNLFRKYVSCPVEVVPLGVDEIPFTERTKPVDRPFRWLWVGAFNPRKGWTFIGQVWSRYFSRNPNVELYMKTTSNVKDLQGLFPVGNAIVDGRNLSKNELEELYASADACIFPTMGEGWGQTLAESMMSGLPCVTVKYSGMLEFANDRNVFFSPHFYSRLKANQGEPSGAPDGLYQFAIPKGDPLGRTMQRVIDDYENALRVGRRAAKDIRKFTWERCARGIHEILTREAMRARRVA